jgi:hypothetical protein
MVARSFSTTEAREQDLLRYALDGHGYIFSCTLIIFHPQVCARSLNSGLTGKTVAEPPVRALVVEKLRAAMGKISTAGVLRLRAIKRCVTR